MTNITIPRSVLEVALDYLTDKRVYAGAFERDDDKIKELDEFIERLRSFLASHDPPVAKCGRCLRPLGYSEGDCAGCWVT